MNQADAHFAGWLMCPVCKKETRHYTKDTHESPVSKMRRIWCEDCRVGKMQFKQTNGKWEQNTPDSEQGSDSSHLISLQGSIAVEI